MSPKTKPSFEKAIDDLEKIVTALESGDLPLDKALQKFEDGMRLSKYCNEMLDEAEKKVTLLMSDDEGNATETPFNPES